MSFLSFHVVFSGSNGVNLVIGEGGVGKNRLAHELMRMAELEFDVPVIKVECRKEQLNAPFAMIVAVLTELVEQTLTGMCLTFERVPLTIPVFLFLGIH
jgi:predicted ATPase